MQFKWIKYLVFFAVLGVIAYNSVYIKKLDASKNELLKQNFTTVAKTFWYNDFKKAIDSAISLTVFEDDFFKNGAQATIDKYAHSQGVSDVAYMLMKFSGTIAEVKENSITLKLANSRTNSINCKVDNYFGNAVRDATGLIKMDDFENTMEYNNVSTQLNQLVKSEVILPFIKSVKVNDMLTVVGCVEIKNGRLPNEILPVKIIINN